MTCNLRDALRTGTLAHHQRLEQRLALLDPALTLPRYRRILAALFGFYRPLEQRLMHLPWGELGFDYQPRIKTPLLQRDLHALGLDGMTILALPSCRRVPVTRTLARAVGVLYVLEGASLGAQVIQPHLERRLGLTPRAGATFFAGYGQRTGMMWRQVLDLLASVAATGAVESDAAVRAACNTFLSLERWLHQRAVLR